MCQVTTKEMKGEQFSAVIIFLKMDNMRLR